MYGSGNCVGIRVFVGECEVIKDIFGNEFSIVEADARRIKRLRLQLSKKFKRENVDNK